MLYRGVLRPILFSMDPESAHHAALAALRAASATALTRRLVRALWFRGTPELKQMIWGLEFPGPVGLAAGFDKHARALPALAQLGFGFLEVGAISATPRAGNPRPRIFRLPRDRGLINRMGLPNPGAAEAVRRLARMRRLDVPLFANVVKSTDGEMSTEDTAAEYVAALEAVAPHVDGFTVNVSCPAAPELRDLGRGDAMRELLCPLVARRDALRGEAVKPLILKVSPDVDDEERDVIAACCAEGLLDGLVLTNTTTRRPESLRAEASVTGEGGGLSGAPLHEIALAHVRWFAERVDVPIIGVGGIFDAAGARRMLDAGAALVEVYTGFVYEGPSLPGRIARGLAAAGWRPVTSPSR